MIGLTLLVALSACSTSASSGDTACAEPTSEEQAQNFEDDCLDDGGA